MLFKLLYSYLITCELKRISTLKTNISPKCLFLLPDFLISPCSWLRKQTCLASAVMYFLWVCPSVWLMKRSHDKGSNRGLFLSPAASSSHIKLDLISHNLFSRVWLEKSPPGNCIDICLEQNFLTIYVHDSSHPPKQIEFLSDGWSFGSFSTEETQHATFKKTLTICMQTVDKCTVECTGNWVHMWLSWSKVPKIISLYEQFISFFLNGNDRNWGRSIHLMKSNLRRTFLPELQQTWQTGSDNKMTDPASYSNM